MDVNLRTPGIIHIVLKPGEICYGERGSMSSTEGGIVYKPIESDSFSSAKRWIGGESFWAIVEFKNSASSNQNLQLRYDVQQSAWFHHNSSETDIFVVDLNKIGGSLIVPAGAYFASSIGVKVSSFFDKNLARSVFGFGKLFKQKITGNGTVFIQKTRYQHLNEVKLEKGNALTIDPKEVYGYSQHSLVQTKGLSLSNFYSGEGFSSYHFKGPATIYTYKNKPVGLSEFNTGSVLRLLFLFYILFLFFKSIF